MLFVCFSKHAFTYHNKIMPMEAQSYNKENQDSFLWKPVKMVYLPHYSKTLQFSTLCSLELLSFDKA